MNIFRERFKGKMFNSLQQEFQFVCVCVIVTRDLYLI